MRQYNSDKTDPVEAIPAPHEAASLALQHTLAAYASLIVTPMVLAGALGWAPEDIVLILSACLVTSGLCTILQCVGFGYANFKIGIRLPVVQGTTIAAIPALIMIGSSDGFNSMFGATIVAGAFAFLLAPWWGKMLRFFPDVVTGSVITIIGIALFPVAIMWMGGGKGFGAQSVDTQNIVLSMGTLVIILAIMKWGSGVFARLAILIGLVSGTTLGITMGLVDFAPVAASDWFAVVTPFAMGWPEFKLTAIIAMVFAMLVTMIESTGDYLAIGEVCNRPVDEKDVTAGLRAEGLGTMLGGVMNSFPYTTYSQNTGVLRISGVRSRWVVALCGVFLIVLGFLPKLSAIAASIPVAVLGGASIVLFGSIASTGIKILGRVDLDDNRNLVVVSVSLGLAMLVISNPIFFATLPEELSTLLGNAITLGGISALLLNAIFQERKS